MSEFKLSCLINDLKSLPYIKCNTEEDLRWILDARRPGHTRLLVPIELALNDIKKFDIVDNLYSPTFDWGSFQGNTTLFPVAAPYQDLKPTSHAPGEYLFCVLLDTDTRRRMVCAPFQFEYIYYSAGTCGIKTGFNTVFANNYLWSVFNINRRNIDELMDEYTDLPVWSIRVDKQYVSGTRLCGQIKDILNTYDDFILEKYIGRMTRGNDNYVACGENVLYSKKAGIVLLDLNKNIMPIQFVFRPLIDVKGVTLDSKFWSIDF